MKSHSKNSKLKYLLYGIGGMVIFIIVVSGLIIASTLNRTQIQFDIRQNKELIYLSTFAEPPQFAIWLEDLKTGQTRTVFVTNRVGSGDWEGKSNVPVALPKWFEIFRENNQSPSVLTDGKYDAVTGATPKEDYFSVRVEVKPGSAWICWIEMNLAGDYNDSFPELDLKTLREDEFACGQPALLYADTITAEEGKNSTPVLVAQSLWENGKNRVEPVSSGVTTARNVFEEIKISVIRPKPKLINTSKS